MRRLESGGFTLIELLTVIAILTILAGVTAAALPRAIEKARLTDVTGDFNAIRTGMTAYYADNGTYPPGYGFRSWYSREVQEGKITGDEAGEWNDIEDQRMFQFTPYMQAIGQYGAIALYDRFAGETNTDRLAQVTRLEFSPIKNLFGGPLYGSNLMPLSEYDPEAMEGPERPYIYAPVNRDAFRRLLAVLRSDLGDLNGNPWAGDTWPSGAADAPAFSLVAPKYDAYVLISVGPEENTAGLASPVRYDGDLQPTWTEGLFAQSLENGKQTSYDVYQALALRTYYLATRDANDNGIPDFDFVARSQQKEGAALVKHFDNPTGHALPDGSLSAGPLIFHQPD